MLVLLSGNGPRHPAALKCGTYMHTYLYAYRHTCTHPSQIPHTSMLHTMLTEEKIRTFFPLLLMPESPNIAAGESNFITQTLQTRFQLSEFYVLEILLE